MVHFQAIWSETNFQKENIIRHVQRTLVLKSSVKQYQWRHIMSIAPWNEALCVSRQVIRYTANSAHGGLCSDVPSLRRVSAEARRSRSILYGRSLPRWTMVCRSWKFCEKV